MRIIALSREHPERPTDGSIGLLRLDNDDDGKPRSSSRSLEKLEKSKLFEDNNVNSSIFKLRAMANWVAAGRVRYWIMLLSFPRLQLDVAASTCCGGGFVTVASVSPVGGFSTGTASSEGGPAEELVLLGV